VVSLGERSSYQLIVERLVEVWTRGPRFTEDAQRRADAGATRRIER
jgi:hypothetical protein